MLKFIEKGIIYLLKGSGVDLFEVELKDVEIGCFINFPFALHRFSF